MSKVVMVRVEHRDVAKLLEYAHRLLSKSECVSLSLVSLLLEASELAILFSEDHWALVENKSEVIEGLRSMARKVALEKYRESKDNGGSSHVCS